MEIKIEDVALSYALQIGVDNVMLEPLKCIADAVRYGMKIQKEEMMKDAEDLVVGIDANGLACVNVDGVLPDDTVRVLVIKED